MANKKVSELPAVNTLNDDDIFVLDHQGSTGTVTFRTIASNVSGGSIPKPTGLAAGNNGNVLTYKHSTTSWVASAANFIPKPTTTSADDGNVLTYKHSTTSWVASAANFIPKPTTTSADDGKVLTYHHSFNRWVASAPSSGGSSLLDNIRIFSGGSTGSWTVPAGVYSIVVTIAAGGGGGGGGGAQTNTSGGTGGHGGGGGAGHFIFSVTPGEVFQYSVGLGGQKGIRGVHSGQVNGTAGANGQPSRFNYPSGTTPSFKQIYCTGGNGGTGGTYGGPSGGVNGTDGTQGIIYSANTNSGTNPTYTESSVLYSGNYGGVSFPTFGISLKAHFYRLTNYTSTPTSGGAAGGGGTGGGLDGTEDGGDGYFSGNNGTDGTNGILIIQW